ncbi:biotin/lipoyl-binding protein, partial [Brucella melitensis]|uniref:biotin/lipoyl-binding protein n=1 Tax=Brucella melitensis TaxID=29459 RepID=UPI003D7645B4
MAAASGKTVSGGRSKTIQPLETAVVKAVHVRDGQHVKQGETLAELEAVGT